MTQHKLVRLIPQFLSDDHKSLEYQDMKREFGTQIFGMLEKQNSKCVVELLENREVVSDHLCAFDRIEFGLHLSDVNYGHVIYTAEHPEYDENSGNLEVMRGIVAMILIGFAAIAIAVLFG